MAKCSILLIDDDPGILKALGKYFEMLGHVVFRAESGKEGIALHQRTRPDVTVLDVNMPGMSGLEVLEILHRRGAVVVMLTGQGEIETAVQAMKLGAENFLTKPVDRDHLAATIDKAAEKVILEYEVVELRRRLRSNKKRLVTHAALVGLLVLASAFIGKRMERTKHAVERPARIPGTLDTNGTVGTPGDSSAILVDVL